MALLFSVLLAREAKQLPALTLVMCYAQVRSWEALEVNWTPAKTRRFQACYWMAWLLAGCFQITFFFLYFGKSLLARLFAEPMVFDEPILCASPILPPCVYAPKQWVHTTHAIGWTAASGLLPRYLLLPVLQRVTALCGYSRSPWCNKESPPCAVPAQRLVLLWPQAATSISWKVLPFTRAGQCDEANCLRDD